MSKMTILILGVMASVGDIVTVNERGEYRGYGRVNSKLMIAAFKKSKKTDLWVIGLVDSKRHEGWGDLDGRVESRKGVWVEENKFSEYFDLIPKTKMVVTKGFEFRKRNLEGFECEVLAPLPRGNSSMVEFKRNVGGCGGDGLGKAGHCLVVPNKNLRAKKADGISKKHSEKE